MGTHVVVIECWKLNNIFSVHSVLVCFPLLIIILILFKNQIELDLNLEGAHVSETIRWIQITIHSRSLNPPLSQLLLVWVVTAGNSLRGAAWSNLNSLLCSVCWWQAGPRGTFANLLRKQVAELKRQTKIYKKKRERKWNLGCWIGQIQTRRGKGSTEGQK